MKAKNQAGDSPGISVRSKAQPPLDAEALMAEAKARTGLNDYGDETLPMRLGIAVEQIGEAATDPAARTAAVGVILWLLTDRLRFFDDRKRYPLAQEQIIKPLIATGEPRSGTTLLHALLSVDPNARALRFWEVMHPSPPPGLASSGDPRRAQADEEWREILDLIPRWLTSHPYNDMLGDGLPECERTWAFDFRILTPTAWWRLPMMMNIDRLPPDPAAQYRLHKMMLQHCQYGQPKKYWVLKGFHSQRLPTLFDTYPDASLIWPHRDPVQTIASRIVLAGQLIESIAGHLDWKAFAAQTIAICRANFSAILASSMLDDPRIMHVRYRDFVSDPVGTIGAYYEKSGVPFTVETEGAMRNYLATNKGDRYGKFEYSLDVIGEDIAALHNEFAPYRERFGIDIEKGRG